MKAYFIVEIVIDDHNYEQTCLIDDFQGLELIESASNTYYELYEPMDIDSIEAPMIDERFKTFQNDSRALKIIGKTPIEYKYPLISKEELLNDENFINRNFLISFLNVFANNDRDLSVLMGLRQQVGNNAVFFAQKNFSRLASLDNGYEFDYTSQPYTISNTIEVSDFPYVANKQSKSLFFYMQKKGELDNNPLVQYINLSGKLKKTRRSEIGNLIAENKCKPILTVIANAEIRKKYREDSDLKVTVRYYFNFYSKVISYSGSMYYPHLLQIPNDKNLLYYEMKHYFAHKLKYYSKIMFANSWFIVYSENLKDDFKKNLKEDFNILSTQIPLIKQMIDKFYYLINKLLKTFIFRKNKIKNKLNSLSNNINEELITLSEKITYNLEDMKYIENTLLESDVLYEKSGINFSEKLSNENHLDHSFERDNDNHLEFSEASSSRNKLKI